MKAFEPVDVYPCTIDEDYINLSVSIASLFGHLCFGSTFTHDEEMERLASQQKTLKRDTNDRDSQIMTSEEGGCVDQRGTSSVSFLGSASDPHSHALDTLERVPKRQRTVPFFPQDLEESVSKTDLITEEVIPRREPPDFKQPFSHYLRRSKKGIPSSNALEPSSNYASTGVSRTTKFNAQVSSTAPQPKTDSYANQIERLATLPVDACPGTQAAPIELFDFDHSSQCKEGGEFLLEDMPEPGDIPNAHIEHQEGPETQITLSDAAFESQSPQESNRNIAAIGVQQRKEAYKTAKEPRCIWGNDHGLISSYAHHGEEEVEL